MIKISRSLKENAAKIRAAESALQTREGREPTLLELTEATGIPQEEIVMALEANYEVESIYKPLGQSEGNEVCLVDRLPEQDRPDERITQVQVSRLEKKILLRLRKEAGGV